MEHKTGDELEGTSCPAPHLSCAGHLPPSTRKPPGGDPDQRGHMHAQGWKQATRGARPLEPCRPPGVLLHLLDPTAPGVPLLLLDPIGPRGALLLLNAVCPEGALLPLGPVGHRTWLCLG